MPSHRPAKSGYARLAQAEEDRGHGSFADSDDEDPYTSPPTVSASAPRYAPIHSRPQMHASAHSSPSGHRKFTNGNRHRLRRDSSGVDIKAINARLERWAEDIASKFKIHKVKGKTHDEESLEIHHTVFQAPDGVRPTTADSLEADEAEEAHRQRKAEFEELVESVRVAIEVGVHPKMISQGSSGSYFARNTDGKVVGVFKPKDEEPYASRNPKWTKWIHRNLFPCFFGRACLIPNLSYVSEAAAHVLDSRLRTDLVPYTDIVYLSSKSFYYDFWDRRSSWRGKKPLPAKVGSFQVFLKGFKDANVFLRQHPWPDQNTASGINAEDAPIRKKRGWSEACRPSAVHSDDEDEYEDHAPSPSLQDESSAPRFTWTETLKQAFREELEKLVILDYIMRNTDRGLDNWMIKIDWKTEEVSILADPPKMNGAGGAGGDDNEHMPPPRPVSVNSERLHANQSPSPYKRHETMMAVSRTGTPSSQDQPQAAISIGAIDNSLSWPWKHPDAWRSFPFGWLFLPVSLIGRPFSQKTKDHFLPLLTSTSWWSGTQTALRRVFSQDSDFKERMFARQIAVMKGQAWNVVETLKQDGHGPLELTRRTRVCVWDDVVDIPVAIPLGVPSTEMHRRAADYDQEEEMDISAAAASEPGPQPDLLNFGSPTHELPNPNRFELSRDQSSAELARAGAGSPGTIRSADYGSLDETGDMSRDLATSWATLPPRPDPDSRSKRRGGPSNYRKRRSLSNHHVNNAFIFGRDDLEGDLGYAAAQGMEGNERKVIVERLETVKSRNPVFTWC